MSYMRDKNGQRLDKISVPDASALSATLQSVKRLSAVPSEAAAFARVATTVPTFTNTDTPTASLSKTWAAATDNTGVLAWHGALTTDIYNSGVRSTLPHGGPTAPIITWEWITDAPLHAIGAVFSSPHILEVDGELVTTTGAIKGTNNYQVIDWAGVRKMRHYRLVAGAGFIMRSLLTTPGDSVMQPAVEQRPLCAWFGDSFSMGTHAVGGLPFSIPYLVGRMLGWRMRTAADGGTGYQNDGSSGGSRVTGHIPDLNGVRLDAAIFAHGLNDPDAGEQAAVTAAIQMFQAAHPGVPVYVIGMWQPSSTFAAAHTARTAAVRAGALAAGAIYIDNDGWVYGTGHVGATAGDGNADVITTTDGTHPDDTYGKPFYAVRIANAIKQANVLIAGSAA